MAHHQQGAVEVVEGPLQGFDRLEVEVVVGSSRTRKLVPRAMSTASAARDRSPGDRAASARAAGSAPRSNLASSERASWVFRLWRPSPCRGERRRESHGRLPMPGPGRRTPTTDAGTQPGDPATGRQAAGEELDQRRLPGAVGAGEGDPVLPANLQVDRAEPEGAPLHECPAEGPPPPGRCGWQSAGSSAAPSPPTASRCLRSRATRPSRALAPAAADSDRSVCRPARSLSLSVAFWPRRLTLHSLRCRTDASSRSILLRRSKRA